MVRAVPHGERRSWSRVQGGLGALTWVHSDGATGGFPLFAAVSTCTLADNLSQRVRGLATNVSASGHPQNKVRRERKRTRGGGGLSEPAIHRTWRLREIPSALAQQAVAVERISSRREWMPPPCKVDQVLCPQPPSDRS
ncbi:hypothetical protein R1flu_012214 [Riccia fluitans]|uniref:Uncharacterized protein n=1 Tax=Riccia fluitans TaxID=41844 RepID=A0ABD1ZE38_9MARC